MSGYDGGSAGHDGIRVEDRRWWLKDKGKAHDVVCHVAEAMIDASEQRHAQDLRHARLYGNMEYLGLTPGTYSQRARPDRMQYNVIASVIDTASSKVAKNRPAPKFVPNGGDWTLSRKARRLNKFGKGVLHASGAYEGRGQIFRDALIFGTGIAKVFNRDKKIWCERRFPWEILVDDQESVYGKPRTMVERRYIDKAVLLDRYGGAKTSKVYKHIEEANPTDRDTPTRDTLSEQIEVFEAWHLPSSEKAKDGRHVIVMNGWTFLDEAWTRESFPFAFYRWIDPVSGFWGTGIGERLKGIQLEMNRLLQKIQRAFRMLGIPWVILDARSGIPETHVTNEIGTILIANGGTVGAEIRVQTNQTVHPEIFAHLWTLEEKAYAQEGISQMYAQGRKAPGLNSGVAQRERNDTESERFVLAGQRWETWHMKIVDLGLEEARSMGSAFTISVPGRKWGERIPWGEVAMAPDAYNLQVWPISILPQTPAARLEAAQELFAAGLMTADQLAETLDLPDVEKAQRSIIAMAQWAEWAIDQMLDEGEYVPPEPFLDLELARDRARSAYLDAEVQGAPEGVLDMLRDFMDACEGLLTDAMKPAPAEAAAMTPGPEGGIAAGVEAPVPPTQLGAMAPMVAA